MYRYFILLSLIFLYSCYEDFGKLDKISTSELDQEYLVPFVNFTSGVNDIIASLGPKARVDTSSAIPVLFYLDTLGEIPANDLVNVYDQDFAIRLTNYPLDTTSPPATKKQLVFDTEEGDDIESIRFRGGFLGLSAATSSSMEHRGFIRITINNLIEERTSLPFSYDMPLSKGSPTGTGRVFSLPSPLYLGGYRVNFTDPSAPILDISILEYVLSESGGVGTYDADLTLTMLDLEFTEITGTFNGLNTNNSQGSREGFFEDGKLKNLEFTNPSMNLLVQNPSPFTARVSVASIKGKDPDIQLNGPGFGEVFEVAGNGAEQKFVFNRDNSNFLDFYSAFPREIMYSFKGESVGSGTSETIMDNSGILLFMEVEAPFDVKIIDYVVYEGDLSAELEKHLDLIRELRVRIESEFPIILVSRIVFLDSTRSPLGSLYENAMLADPAQVNTDGTLVRSSITNTNTKVTPELREIIRGSTYMRVTSTIDTQGDGSHKILSKSKFNFILSGLLGTI